MSTIDTQARQIYCVLIALADDTLLLPNAVISETVGQGALTVNEAEPRWVAGELEWNRRSLTAIRFETLNGSSAAPLTRRARLVVLELLDTFGSTPLALVSQGYPHLITVTREAVVAMPLRANDNPDVVLARVRVGNSEAVIPNLDALRKLVDGLSHSSEA